MTEQTPMPQDTRPPRRGAGMRILLFVSLLLNLVVIGVVGGAILKFSRGDEHPWMMSRELGLGPFMMALEPEQRRALDSAAREHRGDLRSGRVAWRRSFADMLGAIRDDPFDAERFRAAAAVQSDLAAQSRTVGLDLMVENLQEMPTEARRAFAERLEERSRFFGQRRPPEDGRHEGRPKPPPGGY